MASVKGISAYSRTEACIATDDGRTGILGENDRAQGFGCSYMDARFTQTLE